MFMPPPSNRGGRGDGGAFGGSPSSSQGGAQGGGPSPVPGPTPTSGSGTGSLVDQVNAAIADLTAKFITNVAAVNRLTQELALAQAARVVDRAKITRLEAEVQSLLVQLGAANAAFGGAPLVSALASLGTLGVDMSAWTVEWNRLYEEAVLFRTANS